MVIFNNFVAQHQAQLSALNPFLEKWNFKGIKEEHGKFVRLFNERGQQGYMLSRQFIGIFWPGVTVDYDAFIISAISYPHLEKMALILYLDRADSCALQSMAVLMACKKKDHALPATLQDGFKSAGLEMPVDPATGKNPGYRAENSAPLVWCAGFDNEDNGGKSQYNYVFHSLEIEQGTDLIYKPGEIPAWILEK